uniref:Uncharacterized protein n=1 Tax=Arundo donax TaxID=35708 RepID=A0A0A9F7N1_ARUDO
MKETNMSACELLWKHKIYSQHKHIHWYCLHPTKLSCSVRVLKIQKNVLCI